MDKFQVYNRKLNRWEEGELVSGWSENFVLDKTTDSAKVKVKIEGTTMPDWNNGDWCRILHLGENETGATYTEKSVGYKYKSDELISYINHAEEFQQNELRVTFSSTNKENTTITFDATIKGIYSGGTINTTESFSITGENSVDWTYSLAEGVSGIINSVKIENVSPETIIMYKKAYIPKNHEQYVIKNINAVVDTTNDEIDIQLTLGEPIEIAQGILCETMSFTNQIEKIVDGITYSHEPLTHLSVLEKILKVTPANNDNYFGDYNSFNNNSWFNRIKIIDKNILANAPFNDETYSEPSLYEILLNKYDNSIGRTPVFYFDINVETDKPFNTGRAEYILQFERQDGFDKGEIELDTLIENSSEIINSQSDENFTDGLISNFDNLNPNISIYTPQNLWLVPEIDTNERDLTKYISSTTPGTNWCLKLPHKIKDIKNIKRYYLHTDYSGGTYLTPQVDIKNITVLEQKQYNASDATIFQQRTDVAWYKEGDNKIFLNEAYYLPNTTVGQNEGKLWIYQVTYLPLISARYDLGKDYQTQINQNDSQIDSKKFGDYLKDYFSSMNKTDITITKTIEDWQGIVEIGTRVINNDKNYIITNVSVEKRMFDYNVTYQLNENHIRKNDSIQAPQEIRKNIEIGIDATKERKSMYVKKCKITLDNAYVHENILDGWVEDVLFSSILDENLGAISPEIAYLTFKSNVPFVQNNQNSLDLFCEVAKFYIANTICFNIKYFDNAEAGKSKTFASWYDAVESLPWRQIPVLYTDYFGEFNTLTIRLSVLITDDITKIENVDYNAVKNKIMPMVETMGEYPLKTNTSLTPFPTVFKVENIQYYKDMLDTLNYTIGINYEADKNIILCNNFFKNNALLLNRQKVNFTKIKTYTQNIKENDYNIIPASDIVNISTSVYNNSAITITLSSSVTTAKSVCLVDENDNPLLIINDYDKHETNPTFNTITLYC